MPINFNIFLDGEFREGIGLEPDLWIPAADAVNYAVAALRHGTITTIQPLSPETLASEFIPEYTLNTRSYLVFGSFGIGAVIWVYINRKKTRLLIGAGIVWIILPHFLSGLKDPVSIDFTLAGGIWLVWGCISLLRARQNKQGI